MEPWLQYVLLLVTGVVAGTLNVIAGGGSFLTLPALIFLGLPPTVANCTNRVAIFCQNVGAVWGFQRHGVVEWKYLLWAALPATFGAGIGSWAAVTMSDVAFKNILAFLMIGVTLWTLWDPLKKKKSDEEVAEDGPEAGNRKLVPIVARHGPGLDDGDYINMSMQGEIAKIGENKTRNELKKRGSRNEDSGFIVDEDDDEEIPFDKD